MVADTRSMPHAPAGDAFQRLAILIPVFNEVNTIKQILRRVCPVSSTRKFSQSADHPGYCFEYLLDVPRRVTLAQRETHCRA